MISGNDPIGITKQFWSLPPTFREAVNSRPSGNRHGSRLPILTAVQHTNQNIAPKAEFRAILYCWGGTMLQSSGYEKIGLSKVQSSISPRQSQIPICKCCSPDLLLLTKRLMTIDPGWEFSSSKASGAQASSGNGSTGPQQVAGAGTLFTNIALFDGDHPNLRQGMSVLILGEKIAAVTTDDIIPPEDTYVIDCGGRTLMPGLIDAHWHTMFAAMSKVALQVADVGDIHFAAARQAERTLMRGFTTVRDMGGPCFALKRAIDSGYLRGPRIFPSGAMISQTGGHGDYRFGWEVMARANYPSRGESLGAAVIADGRNTVLRSTREQLLLGASQIKIMAGGGVASAHDPIDVTQFLPEEMEAAVCAAADWGTYVAAHAYTSAAVQRCLNAGVRSIEHGQLIDAETAKMIADHGAVWSLQPFVPELSSGGEEGLSDDSKMREIWLGTDNAYQLAIIHNIRTGWGSDILFDPAAAERQGASLAYLKRWYSPAQAIMQATSQNAAILALSGLRSPYKAKLGVIEPQAFADLLLVDGDPTENLDLLADPDLNLALIMKGGQIFKNNIPCLG